MYLPPPPTRFPPFPPRAPVQAKSQINTQLLKNRNQRALTVLHQLFELNPKVKLAFSCSYFNWRGFRGKIQPKHTISEFAGELLKLASHRYKWNSRLQSRNRIKPAGHKIWQHPCMLDARHTLALSAASTEDPMMLLPLICRPTNEWAVRFTWNHVAIMTGEQLNRYFKQRRTRLPRIIAVRLNTGWSKELKSSPSAFWLNGGFWEKLESPKTPFDLELPDPYNRVRIQQERPTGITIDYEPYWLKEIDKPVVSYLPINFIVSKAPRLRSDREFALAGVAKPDIQPKPFPHIPRAPRLRSDIEDTLVDAVQSAPQPVPVNPYRVRPPTRYLEEIAKRSTPEKT